MSEKSLQDSTYDGKQDLDGVVGDCDKFVVLDQKQWLKKHRYLRKGSAWGLFQIK